MCRGRKLGLRHLFQSNDITRAGSAPTMSCEAADEAICVSRLSPGPLPFAQLSYCEVLASALLILGRVS